MGDGIVRLLVSCQIILLVNTFNPNTPEFVEKREKMLSFIYQDQCNELNFLSREFENTKRWHYVTRPLSVRQAWRAKEEWDETKSVGDAACMDALLLLTSLPSDEIYECAGAVLPKCRELFPEGWTCTILFHDADRIDPPLLLSMRFCTMVSYERYANYRFQVGAEAGASSRSSSHSSRSSSESSRALGKVLDDGIRGSNSGSKGKLSEGRRLNERSRSRSHSGSRDSKRRKSPNGGSQKDGTPKGEAPRNTQVSNGDLLNAYVANYTDSDWEGRSGSSKKSRPDMVSDWVHSSGYRYWDTGVDKDLETGGPMDEERRSGIGRETGSGIGRETGSGSMKSHSHRSGSLRRSRVRDWVTETANKVCGRFNSKDRGDRSSNGKARHLHLKLNKPRLGDVSIDPK